MASPWLWGAALLGGGLLWARSQGARVRPVSPTPSPTGFRPYEPPDIAGSMPEAEDFPMGWEVIDSAFGASESSGYTWRLLKLNSPSDKCSPTPCEWVTVFAGIAPTSSSFGWRPTVTRDDAYDELERQVEKYG